MIKYRSLIDAGLLLGVFFSLSGSFACSTQFAVNEPAKESSRPCYAFLQNGDLWAVCEGQRHKIDMEGRGTDFAISSDGSRLIVSRKKVGTNHGSIEPRPELMEVSLKDQTSKVVDLAEQLAPIDLRSSCGTIVTIARDPDLNGRVGLVYDVTEIKLLNASTYKSLHCSNDRQVKGGWSSPEESILNVSWAGREEMYPAARWQDFDVSPSGKYIAYFLVSKNSDIEVCINQGSSRRICVHDDGQPYLLGRVNVSDASEIIYESSNDAGCYYKDRNHYSQSHLPGYKLEDPCPSIFYWRPSQEKPTVLEPLGDHPQWITPEIAHKLRNNRP